MQMKQLDRILQHLESEMPQTWAEEQGQAQNYEALLSIKVNLQAEMATYCHPLGDREDFDLGGSMDNSNCMQSIQETTIRRAVDNTAVSEVHTKVLSH